MGSWWRWRTKFATRGQNICIYIYIYMITKFQIEHRDHSYNVKVLRPSNHLSRHAQTFPSGDGNLQEVSYHLRGSRVQKGQLKQMLGFAAS